MVLTSISKLWNSGVRRYLRPVELLRGVAAGCRLAWNNLTGIDKLISNNIPVGYGSLYDTISLPLSYIGKNRNVAGVGHIFPEDFPYIIVGAPRGIIHFTTSPVKLGAAKHHEFIEHSGVYYFKHDPTTFGIVNTKGGDTCTFLIARAGCTTLGFQDLNNKYRNSGCYRNNQVISAYDTRSGATNGISNRLYLLSAGVVVPESNTEIAHQWIEGGSLYILTKSGELIKDANTTELLAGDTTLAAGVPATEGYTSKYLLYPGTDGSVYAILNTGDTYTTADLPGLSEVIPEIAGSTTAINFQTLHGLLTHHGIVTINTNEGDADVQLAIDKRTSPVSCLYQSQYLEAVTYTNAATAAGFPSGDSNYAYLYFDGSDKFTAPAIFPGISAREAILNQAARYAIVRVPLQSIKDRKVAISINGDTFGRSVACGMYLKSIVLAYNDENNYITDTILNHINISTPVQVNAGRCVVVVINESGGADSK